MNDYNLTNEEKAQKIHNGHVDWVLDFVDERNLTCEDQKNIRFHIYMAAVEMAQWKDAQRNAEERQKQLK